MAHAKANPLDPVKKWKIGSGMNQGKVTEDTLRDMRTHLTKTPTLTARSLKRLVPGLANTSIRQIQDICLKKLNLPSRKMASKPVLTDKMREKRLALAHQYGHWTVDDWKKVLFSDEPHFELQFTRQVRCRRPQGSDRFSPQFTRKTVKHPAKVMVWGCFSWRGRGALEFLKKGEMMNGARYWQILEEKLELFMHQHGTTHFLQDGAPCHKSKLVSAWFQQPPAIQLIDWPGNSPDLNPIENCWSWMKTQLQDCKATSIPELQCYI